MVRAYKATGPVSVSQDALSRKLLEKEKAEVSQSTQGDEPAEVVETGVHYGRRFAETQSRFRMKRAKRYEELGDEGAGTFAGGEPTHPEAAPRMAGPVTAELPEAPPMPPRGQPIGGLPPVEELYPPQRLSDLYEHATRRVQAVTHAVNDLWQASLQVLMLPRDAAQLLARRIQILKLG